MNTDLIKKKANELVNQASIVLKTEYSDGRFVNREMFAEFRLSSLSFLERILTKEDNYYKEFYQKVSYNNVFDVEIGRGILKALTQDIEDGFLINLKDLVSAELFNDFMDMAEYLLKMSYKDPAAIIIGSVLEEKIRQLCKKFEIKIYRSSSEIDERPKAESMNIELCKEKKYNLVDQKQITAWLDIRNKAAHGHYDEYTKEQIELMYVGVLNFISRIN